MPTEYLTVAGDNTSQATYARGRGTNPVQTFKTLTPTSAIAISLDDAVGALDSTTFGYILSRIAGMNANPGHMDFSFSVPPAAVIVNSVKLYGYLRTSQAGANEFNANPQVFGFILPAGCTHTAALGTQHNGSTVTVTNNLNTNTKPPGKFELYLLGTWSTNPHTAGAWSVSELASGGLFAGVKANSPNIPYSHGSNQNSFDVGQLYLQLDVTPSESVFGPAKFIAAAALRLRHVARRMAEFQVAAPLADLEPGSHVWVVDRFYPTPDGAGTTIKNWDRRPIHVLAASEDVEQLTSTIRGLDLRPVYASFWSTWRTDLGVAETNTGIPQYDRGGSYEFTRQITAGTDQGAWVWQSGDGLFRNLAAGKVRFAPWGLVVVGGEIDGSTADTGEHTWANLYNTFSGGSGTTFTNWTQSSGGAGGTLAEDTSVILFDLDTYRRGPKFTNGATAADYEQLRGDVASLTTNHRGRYFVKFTPHGETDFDQIEVLCQRTSDSFDWVPGTGFSSGAGWHDVTDIGDGTYGYGSITKVGDHYEYWSDEVQVGASTTIYVFVGKTAVGAGSVTVHAAGFIHNNANTTARQKRVMRRDFVATTSAAIEQAADRYTLPNVTDYKWLDEDAGFVSFVYTPLFDHLDLDDDAKKFIFSATYDLTNQDYHAVYYQRLTSTTAAIYFSHVRGATVEGLASFALSGAGLASYMVPIKIAVRLIGPDAEHGFTAGTLSVFVDGVKGTDDLKTADLRYDGEDSVVHIGHRSTALTTLIDHSADGVIADGEAWKGRCPSDVEVARIHAGIGLNLDVPTVL